MNSALQKEDIRLSGNESFEGRLKAVSELYGKHVVAAGHAQISVDQLRAYQNGKSKASWEPVARLAKGKGVSLDWLYTGEGEIFLKEEQGSLSINDDKTETYNVPVSQKELLDKYNVLNDLLNDTCDDIDFYPPKYIQEAIKTMMFSDQLTKAGVIVLIRALKTDYDTNNPDPTDPTI